MTTPQNETTINMRTTVELKAQLRRAAELRNTSLTQFILDAAVEKADKILAEYQVTVLPAEFFDAFYESLSGEGHPNQALRDLAATERPYEQR